jgi:hypothetical protein
MRPSRFFFVPCVVALACTPAKNADEAAPVPSIEPTPPPSLSATVEDEAEPRGEREERLPAMRATGVSECDAYFFAMRRCMRAMSPEQRTVMEQALEAMRGALLNGVIDKGVLASSCRAALDATRGNPACK